MGFWGTKFHIHSDLPDPEDMGLSGPFGEALSP